MEGTGRPEYGKVVDICTRDSLRELATPGILAIFAPIAVGFGLGVGPLGAYLAGAIATGTLMAVFLANSGGAWDNAKKLVEDGNHGGKGSPAHEATIIGDTVGDPFKDTAGPAINPLLKVMNLVALLIVPLIIKYTYGDDASELDPLLDRRRRGADHRGGGLRLEASPDRARGRHRRRARAAERPGRVVAPCEGAIGVRPPGRSRTLRHCAVLAHLTGWADDRRRARPGPPRGADPGGLHRRRGVRAARRGRAPRPRPQPDRPGADGRRAAAARSRPSCGCSRCRCRSTATVPTPPCPDLVEPLVAAGMLDASGGEVRALVDVRPYGDEDHDWWIVCDPTPGLDGRQAPMDRGYVLGISEASSSLAQLTIREPVGRALDLGTGCGVQALHLAQHAARSSRPTSTRGPSRWPASPPTLNGVDIDVRDGSLFEPVAGETFDLIATNPPFVISPPGSEVLVYRDSGMPGDSVVRHLVENAASAPQRRRLVPDPRQLGAPDGTRLAGRTSRSGSPGSRSTRGSCSVSWSTRPSTSRCGSPMPGWPTAPDYVQRYDAWLDWFADERHRGGRLRLAEPAQDLGCAGAPLRGVGRRDRAAGGPGGRGLGPAHRRAARARRRGAARPRVPAGARPGRGDPRAGRRRAPRGDRAAPPAGRTPCPPGRHRRGRAGQRERGRSDGRPDPRRPRVAAGPRRRRAPPVRTPARCASSPPTAS